MSSERVGGYAPGSYLNRCRECGQEFTGDKRAISCLPCATAKTSVRHESMRTGYGKLMDEAEEATLAELEAEITKIEARAAKMRMAVANYKDGVLSFHAMVAAIKEATYS